MTLGDRCDHIIALIDEVLDATSGSRDPQGTPDEQEREDARENW